jgi:hypothetical protein
MSDPRTFDDLPPAEVGAFEFDRIPGADAELVLDVVEQGLCAQISEVARRNYFASLMALLNAYQKELWP